MNAIATVKDRILGCLYGQAIGNALGLITEFMNKQEVLAHFPEKLVKYPQNKGIWEDDDTNQMLCLLNELKENGKIIPESLASRLDYWLESDGRGCGNLVYNVIRHRDFLENPFKASFDRWKLSHYNAAPNGALMRTSVIGVMPGNIEADAVSACKVTHHDPRCVGSCVILCEIIHNLVWNDKELSFDEIVELGNKYDERIKEWVELAYSSTDISQLDLDESSSIGYTLRSLAAALWCYWHARDFQDGLTSIVNEGGDADTNAAIACSVLGAKFGFNAIPPYYIDNLLNGNKYRDIVLPFVEKLYVN